MKRNSRRALSRAVQLVRAAVDKACKASDAALLYQTCGKKRSERLSGTACVLYASAATRAESPAARSRRRIEYRVLSDIAEALLYIARFESGDPSFSTDYDAIDAAFEEAAETVNHRGRFVRARIKLPGGTILKTADLGILVVLGGVETLHVAGTVYDAAKTVLDFVARK